MATADDLPDELRSTATSLRILLGERVDRSDLARSLIRRIDDWYERARANGATGGKITGAGGGGFLLLYAPKDCHEAIVNALPELRRVSFGFEPHGTTIIYVEESECV